MISFTGSTYTNSDNMCSATTTVDPRYEKLRNEFLKWCTGWVAKKHIFDKTKITCFGCMAQARTFDKIKHSQNCDVAIALEII